MSHTGLDVPVSPFVLHPPATEPGGTTSMPRPHMVSPADISDDPFLLFFWQIMGLVYILSSCVMPALMDVELTQIPQAMG